MNGAYEGNGDELIELQEYLGYNISCQRTETRLLFLFFHKKRTTYNIDRYTNRFFNNFFLYYKVASLS